jgi:hypothetical protein
MPPVCAYFDLVVHNLGSSMPEGPALVKLYQSLGS